MQFTRYPYCWGKWIRIINTRHRSSHCQLQQQTDKQNGRFHLFCEKSISILKTQRLAYSHRFSDAFSRTTYHHRNTNLLNNRKKLLDTYFYNPWIQWDSYFCPVIYKYTASAEDLQKCQFHFSFKIKLSSCSWVELFKDSKFTLSNCVATFSLIWRHLLWIVQ